MFKYYQHIEVTFNLTKLQIESLKIKRCKFYKFYEIIKKVGDIFYDCNKLDRYLNSKYL